MGEIYKKGRKSKRNSMMQVKGRSKRGVEREEGRGCEGEEGKVHTGNRRKKRILQGRR
jgi:hypothetical protein